MLTFLLCSVRTDSHIQLTQVDDSFQLLKDTLKWRDDRDVWRLRSERADMLSHEMCTGKEYRSGRDLQNRPICYIRDRRQNTRDYDNQVDCVINMLERACETMELDKGVETWTLIFDFRGYAYSNAPPLHTCREVLDIFQAKYPERLGQVS